jgi:hypothetical protein
LSLSTWEKTLIFIEWYCYMQHSVHIISHLCNLIVPCRISLYY